MTSSYSAARRRSWAVSTKGQPTGSCERETLLTILYSDNWIRSAVKSQIKSVRGDILLLTPTCPIIKSRAKSVYPLTALLQSPCFKPFSNFWNHLCRQGKKLCHARILTSLMYSISDGKGLRWKRPTLGPSILNLVGTSGSDTSRNTT